MESETGKATKDIALEIQRLIDQEEPGVLALVVRSVGSAPGKVGSKSIVLPDGSISGTVGGGIVEARVIADSLRSTSLVRIRISPWTNRDGKLGAAGSRTTEPTRVVEGPGFKRTIVPTIRQFLMRKFWPWQSIT